MIKIVKQHDDKDCGAACTAMVASKFGIYLSLIEAREKLHIDNNGCSVYAMTKALEEFGVDADGYTFNGWSDFEDAISKKMLDFPFVANIVNQEGISHYIIVLRLGKKMEIIDPAFGKLKIPIENFKDCWTGIIIKYKSNKTIERKKIRKFSLPDIIKEMILVIKYGILKIGIVSVLTSVFSFLNIIFFQKLFVLIFSNNKEKHIEHHFQVFENDTSTTILKEILVWLSDKYHILFLLIIICIFQLLLRLIRGKIYIKISNKFDFEVFNQIFKRLLNLPLDYFESRRVGEITSRFNDIFKIREAFMNIMAIIFNDAVTIIVLNILLFVFCKELIIFELIIAIIYFVYILLQQKPLNKRINNLLIRNEKLASFITTIVTNIITIKIGNKEFFIKRVKEKSLGLVESVKKVMNLNIIINSINSFLVELFIVILLMFGVFLFQLEKTSGDEFFIGFLICSYLLQYLRNISNFPVDFQNLKCGLARLEDIYLAKMSYSNIENSSLGLNVSNNIIVSFENVSFNYGYTNEGIRDINFTAYGGNKVAFVGNTGSGKSTIAKLLMSLYKPDLGNITVSHNKKIGYLSQEICIFNESIRDNIILGCDVVSKEFFEKICRITMVDEIAKIKSNGYNTIMDEKGYDFSKGERQRIALARVLFTRPDIIIFDEMGSSLDAITEKTIIQNIIEEFRDNLLFFISHRLTSITMCDQIYVMNDGKIVQSGNHQQLLEEGEYLEMWRNQ